MLPGNALKIVKVNKTLQTNGLIPITETSYFFES